MTMCRAHYPAQTAMTLPLLHHHPIALPNSDKIDHLLNGLGDTTLVILLANAILSTPPTTGITCGHRGASNDQPPITH